MLTLESKQILNLIQREVVPAIGCTEPIAVALAVAKAKEVLGEIPSSIEVFLSANVLKNAMGVGIPGTGMIGLPIAIALGAIIGKPEYELEVLKDLSETTLNDAKRMVEKECISIQLKSDTPDKLYIEAICAAENANSKVVICGSHTNIAYVEYNGKVFKDTLGCNNDNATAGEELKLTFDKVYDFAMETPVEELRFILKAVELNKIAADESKKGTFGHSVSKVMESGMRKKIMGNSIMTRLISVTTAACDVRMAGAMIPVMSNSGSGNQGITATLPVAVFAEEMENPEENLIRALILSNLMVIFIKRKLGRLSGLCGVMVAGIGSGCGITYLMGGTREQVANSVKNMIGDLTGVICDGAKPSCALKVSTAVSTATIASLMAIDNKVISSSEGITDNDVDKTINNLTDIGSNGMLQTDEMVLKIMTTK